MTSSTLTVIIDVPRWSFIKRDDCGSVDFVSPLPTPFNYGHVPDTLAEDGDAFDAVVLGSRLARGTRIRTTIRGRVGFVDGGSDDPKWICSSEPLTPGAKRHVEAFFRRYALVKRLINRLRGMQGPTRYLGWL